MNKFLERKFTIPGLAGLLPIANEMGSMGLDFKTLVLVGAMAIAWAAIEAAQDIAKMRYGGLKLQAPDPSSPPSISVSSK